MMLFIDLFLYTSLILYTSKEYILFSMLHSSRSQRLLSAVALQTFFTLVVSTIGATLPAMIPLAEAAATVGVDTSGLQNGFAPDALIAPSSPATAIVKLRLSVATAGQLTSVQVNFSGTGFATSDLLAIGSATGSGVALYTDNGSSNGNFDVNDQVVRLAGVPDWTSGTSSIILTPASTSTVSLTSTERILYVVFKTSGTISNGDRVIATIPINGVITSSDGNGPASVFNSNSYKCDTVTPAISAVEGFIGSPTVTIRFNKQVQKVGGGNLTASEFVYTNNGSGLAISSVSHMAGQSAALVTMNGNLAASDITDGSPSQFRCGSNKCADMAGNVVGTTDVNITSPIGILNSNVSSTVAATVFTSGSPLVTFIGAGGSGSGYFCSPADAVATSTLTSLGLALIADTCKITGTVANVSGSFSFGVKLTDSAAANSTRVYTVNVGSSSGGSIPGISSVTPAGGPQNTTSMNVSVVGSNTVFTAGSQVTFLMPPGTPGTNGVSTTTGSSVTFTDATHITLPVVISASAVAGPRDLQIKTGTQTVTMPNAFTVFAGGMAGLNLLLPANGATGLGTIPGISFSQTANSSVLSYEIILKSGLDFSGSLTPLWDYAFDKTVSESTSHCNSTQCNLSYGVSRFRVLTSPTPLTPNTTYFLQIKGQPSAASAVTGSTIPVESTIWQSFSTAVTIADTVPPSIFHANVNSAAASAALNVFARVVDNVAMAQTSPALQAKILHCQGNGCTPNTVVNGTLVANGYYRFTIPASGSGIGSAGVVTRYQMQASDGTNTFSFPNGGVTTTAATVGSATITGTVQDSTGACPSAVQGATVYAEGTGSSATTDGSCAFTLSSLFPGTYEIVAVKDGFGERRLQGIPSGTTGLTVQLGASGFTGGFGGDTTRPTVRFTCPMNNSTNIPGGDSNFKLCVAFNKDMSESTLTSTNLLVKEINISTGVATNITTTKGSWTYYPTAPSVPGVPPEARMAVWTLSGASTFGDNKTIGVVVTGNVTDSAGNAIQSNQPDGSYAFSFTTGQSFSGGSGSFTGGGGFGTGASFTAVPRVMGSLPGPGSTDNPTNMVMNVNFSEALADDSSPYFLRNFIKVFPTSDSTETSLVTATSLDSTKKNVTLTLSGSLTASTAYRLKVLGGAKGGSGITIGPTGMSSQEMFRADFRTGTGADTTVPTVVGSFPDNNATNIGVNIGSISMTFNTNMDASTITTNSFTVMAGSSNVNGSVSYKPLERRAVFVPLTALSPTTTYSLGLSTDVKASNGTALTTAVARTFTTGGADTTPGQISYINVDDHAISVTFFEPMMAVNALNTLNWNNSVLNPSVYDVIRYGDAGFNPASAGTDVSLAAARFTWNADNGTVLIEGLDLVAARGKELYFSMDTSGPNRASDLSGNLMVTSTGNTGRAPVRSSATTGGSLGPGARMGTGSDFAAGGGTANFASSFTGNTNMGFIRSPEVRPASPEVSLTSKYFVKIPISTALAAGDKIVLTFPNGTDVSGAKQDTQSPFKADWNMGASGTPTFKCTGSAPLSCASTVNADDTGAAQGGAANDGVVVNSTARTVTIYISAATNANDFLNIDLDGIVNPPTPSGIGTTGLTVDIKTLSGSTLRESMTSAPFFIQASRGSNTVSGTITMTGNSGTCNVTVYLMSPTTGPRSTTAAFTGAATTTYTFSNIGAGDVFINTDRSITCGSTDFTGKMIPDRVLVSGNTTDNFTLAAASGGSLVNVSVVITGGSGKSVDVFAGGAGDFRVKSVTLSSSPQTVTLALPDGFSGFLGVGPQMNSGFNTNGPPQAPDYVLPRPKDIKVTGSACYIDGTAGCTANYTLTSASKTIKGIVKDGSGKVMSNVPVFAYSQGGFGTGGVTGADGTFTLNVTDGTYNVGANFNGVQSREVSVVVTSDSTTYLKIDGATTAITPAAAASSFVLKVAKPECTISGSVTDGTNALQNSGVFANLTTGPGFANAMTDSSGNYTLYVNCTGSYSVRAFAPGYGQMAAQTVTMSGSSQSSISFSPSLTGTYYSVSGRVYNDRNGNSSYDSGASPAEEMVGAFVRIRNSSNFNECVTDTAGNYKCQVPSGNGYTVRAFSPTTGETPPLAAFNVTADVTGKDISVANPNTVTFVFSTTTADGFVDLVSTTGLGNHASLHSATSVSMSIPNGTYQVKLDVPGALLACTDVAGRAGTAFTASTCALVVDGTETLDVTMPTGLRTISGTITDGSAAISEAWVEITQVSSNMVMGAKANSSGVFSVKVPNGSYNINAMKAGYVRQPTTLTVTADMTGQTLAMTQSSLSISGQVFLPGGSTGAANAFIRATQQGTSGFAGTQADSSGNYSLPVTAGTWRISALAQGYAETSPASVVVGSSAVTGQNITVVTTVSLNPPTTQTISASNGGTYEDTTAGVSVIAGQNVLTADGSSVNITAQETNAPKTPTVTPLPGVTLTAQTGDTLVTNFQGDVTIDLTYTPAELAAQTSSNGTAIDTLSEVNALQMGAYDTTLATWKRLPTTIKCQDSSNNIVASPTTVSSCDHFSIAAVTNHFSTYAPVSAASGAPSTPSGLAASAGGTTSISLSWTAVSGASSYDIYRSTTSDGTYARVGGEPTVSSGSTVSYSDTGLVSNTIYYYEITSLNDSGESAPSASTNARTSNANTGGGGTSSSGSSGISSSGGSSSSPVTTSPIVTTPVVTVPVTTTPVVTTPVVTTPVITAAPAAAGASASTQANVAGIQFSGLAEGTVIAPGKPIRYGYHYVNSSGKAQSVRLLREMVDAKGKVVKTSKGTATLKAGAALDKSVSEILSKSLKVGAYAVRVTVMDSKGKVLSKQTMSVQVGKVTKPAPAAPAPVAPAPAPAAPSGPVTAGVSFSGIVDGAALAPGQALQFTYSYGNTTNKAQSVAITRELVDADGKTVQHSSGSGTVKAGAAWNANVKDKLPKTLKPGSYSLIVTVKDKKSGETLNENTIFVQVR